MKHVVLLIACVLMTATSSAQEPPAVGRPQASESAHQPRTFSTQKELAKEYIQRRAQEKAEARRARIEGYRTMGYSPLRPSQSSTPFMSHPPTWQVTYAWPCHLAPGFWAYPVGF